MLTKKQNRKTYDECVIGIRQIKDSNDRINKSIGILNEGALQKQIQVDRNLINELFAKTQQTVNKMQKSYLDPDTIRKIAIIRQQMSLQKERRSQLLKSAYQIINQHKKSINVIEKTRKPIKQSLISTRNISEVSTSYGRQQELMNSQKINQKQLQIQRKIVKQRSQQILNSQKKLEKINSVLKQTQSWTKIQGQKIDIITDDMFITLNNVDMSNNELAVASQKNKKSSKKYTIFISFILLIILGIVILLFFIF